MSKGIYAALSGAIAQTTALETTAQNLANASTTGYRGARPIFREVLAQAAARGQRQRPAPAGKGGEPLHFGAVASTAIDTSPGAIRSTGRPLDVALPPNAFLAVSTSRGERYTRAGALSVTSDGILRGPSSEAVLSENGEPIHVDPQTPVAIEPDGQVTAAGEPVARLRIVTFAKPEQLTREAATLFAATPGAGAATPSGGELSIGMLEESNASTLSAMNDLVTATRMFDAFERAIDAFRDADHKVATTVPSAG